MRKSRTWGPKGLHVLLVAVEDALDYPFILFIGIIFCSFFHIFCYCFFRLDKHMPQKSKVLLSGGFALFCL